MKALLFKRFIAISWIQNEIVSYLWSNDLLLWQYIKHYFFVNSYTYKNKNKKGFNFSNNQLSIYKSIFDSNSDSFHSSYKDKVTFEFVSSLKQNIDNAPPEKDSDESNEEIFEKMLDSLLDGEKDIFYDDYDLLNGGTNAIHPKTKRANKKKRNHKKLKEKLQKKFKK